jgi:uncharacterized protein YndB with AHSA1/START domain
MPDPGPTASAVHAVVSQTVCGVTRERYLFREARMQQSSKGSIELTQAFSVPPLILWQAWTEPHVVVRWFGSDPKGTVAKAALDVRIGGSFEVTFRNADGTEHTCFGTYKEVVFCKKLVFSWSWKSSPSIVERVQVQFVPIPQGTKMTFEHSDIKEGTGHNYMTGWKNTFKKLEHVLSSRQ